MVNADGDAPPLLYFEAQRAALCGVHALNTLLQGPYFSEWDLAAVGQSLDDRERKLMAEQGTNTADYARFAAESSGNVAMDGNFSIQVLEEALTVFCLSCVPLTKKTPEAEAARDRPDKETGFLLNLDSHWFTLRKLGREWWRFNSLDAAPQPVSDTYLAVLLVQLQHEGWSVHVVKGSPWPQNSLYGSTSTTGRWLTREEAAEALARAQRDATAGRTRSAVDDALARAGPSGMLTLRPRRDVFDAGDDEDLRRAMAASLGEDHHSARGQSGAAAAEDEDAELARAIAASLDEEPSAIRRRIDAPIAIATAAAAPDDTLLPNEPPADADGVWTLAFRLPEAGRLTRRFYASDTLASVAAFLGKAAGIAMAQHRLIHGHPPVELLDPAQTLLDAQLQDRSVISVLPNLSVP
jgi:Ataxin-3